MNTDEFNDVLKAIDECSDCLVRLVRNEKFEKIIENIKKHTKFLDGTAKKISINQRVWHFQHIEYLNSIPVCKTCGTNYVKYRLRNRKYSTFCSSACSMNDKEVQESYKNSIKEKYGVESPWQIDEVKKKRKESIKERFGVDNLYDAAGMKEKISSGINKFKKDNNVTNASQLPSIQEKIKSNNLKKYGVTHVMKLRKFSDKALNVKREKYNGKTASESGIRNRLIGIHKGSYKNMMRVIEGKFEPLFTEEDYVGRLWKTYKFFCKMCNSSFEHTFNHVTNIPRCLVCNPLYSSKPEKELYDYLVELLKDSSLVKRTDRELCAPYEVDILIDSKKIAIEFNGIYYHSYDKLETIHEKNYHLMKTEMCNEKHFHLIHIFENEWNEKKDIVKSMLASKLGISERIGARKCVIKEVSKQEEKDFLNKSHIQGSITSSYSLGLYFNSELVSLMTFGKSRYNKNYEWELLRFCNKLGFSVQGAAKRLLTYFEKNKNPNNLLTYADRRYSKGNLYVQLDFVFSHFSKPNYFYVDESMNLNRREKYQKHKLTKIIKIFDNSKTEAQNMFNNGFRRIWDCGNYVFHKFYNKEIK